MRTSHVVRVLLGALAAVQILSAMVDCGNPKNPEHQVVCGNQELLALDRQLSTAYQQALEQSGANRSTVECDQWLWENSGLQCYGKTECIRERYIDRIANLRRHEKPNVSAFNKRLCEAQRRGAAQEKAEEARRAAQSAEFNARIRAVQEAAEQREQNQKAQKADADAKHSAAETRLKACHTEMRHIDSAITAFKESKPRSYSLSDSAWDSEWYRANWRRTTEEFDELSRKCESNLPKRRDELANKQKEALLFAKDLLQHSPKTKAAAKLEHLIESADNSADAALTVYLAAKKLEADTKALAVTEQRADKDVASARTVIASASKFSGDSEIAAAIQTTTQTTNDLSAKARTNDPDDEPQISTLASRLEAQQAKLNRLVRQQTVMATNTGKQVYQGCLAWAKRKGMGTSSGVRVFKDDSTNKSADLAVNQGTHLCRCMAVEIAGDREITDEAKLEIAHQFETRDQMNNQALAAVVGVAGGRCQLQLVDELSGGQLSGGR